MKMANSSNDLKSVPTRNPNSVGMFLKCGNITRSPIANYLCLRFRDKPWRHSLGFSILRKYKIRLIVQVGSDGEGDSQFRSEDQKLFYFFLQ